jgi:hypothetical protein
MRNSDMATDDELSGGGTGGAAAPSGSKHSEFFDDKHIIVANQLELLARHPMPELELPSAKSTITLLATANLGPVPDPLGTEGEVDVRGAKAVRITSGPCNPLQGPPTQSDSTNGVEIAVGEAQKITILRGLLPGVDQKIEMDPGSITIDGGAGSITIQSLTQITLSVAGGVNTITMTPEGITIQGLMITIQGALVQIN